MSRSAAVTDRNANAGRILPTVNSSSRGGHDPGSDRQEHDPDGHIDEEIAGAAPPGNRLGDAPLLCEVGRGLNWLTAVPFEPLQFQLDPFAGRDALRIR